ncbi:MAG: carbohydrate kinase family protein [Oscillospiraceae bacterium]|nr:carbohydrate kinase family protein [Oscillospiraceae bacterium]
MTTTTTIDGTFLGKHTKDLTHDFFKKIGVDFSAMHYSPDYDGMDEFVMVDSKTRTNFSTFVAFHADYWERGNRRWNELNEADIRAAKAVGLDPWFDKQSFKVVEICRENNIPFVTIDEKPDNYICKLASIIAGDTFKAGCVYSLLHGFDDDKTVQFASAAYTKFPIGLNPPTLGEVEALIKDRNLLMQKITISNVKSEKFEV